jgi:hypothetical protein
VLLGGAEKHNIAHGPVDRGDDDEDRDDNDDADNAPGLSYPLPHVRW